MMSLQSNPFDCILIKVSFVFFRGNNSDPAVTFLIIDNRSLNSLIGSQWLLNPVCQEANELRITFPDQKRDNKSGMEGIINIPVYFLKCLFCLG